MLQLRSLALRAATFLLITSFCIGFVNTIAIPGRYAIERRDDVHPTPSSSAISDATTSAAASISSVASSSGNPGKATVTNSVVSSNASESAAPTSTSSLITSIRASTTISSLPSQTTLTGSSETGLFNSTLTPNLLPITPTITPAFSIAGVLLILTGILYAFISLKSPRLHIFLSGAYLTSLSITVLILYITNPPISNATQGIYLVAILLPGIVVGGAAIIFPDMTEGIGCILGGFALAMWFLVMKPGGLLTSTSGICILISIFCALCFGLSFSRYTRPYGLIFSLSFAGATAIVLGIDCFSRAGLKEFWAWVFHLNDNLFPLGSTSYPITRGIRVEIAAIFVLFLAGVAAQTQLWKIIKKKKDERKERKKREDEVHEREEIDVGRRVQERNGRERDRWEAVYGNDEKSNMKKQEVTTTTRSIADSGVGDMENPRKTSRSTATSSYRPSTDEEIEMTDVGVTASPKVSDPSVMSSNKQDGSVTVRVAHDDQGKISTIPEFEGDEGQFTRNRDARTSNCSTKLVEASSERKDKSHIKTTSVPEIIPIPFQVPDELDPMSDDHRSSIATYNDTEILGGQENRWSGLERLSRTAIRNSQRLSGISLDGISLNGNSGWSRMENLRNVGGRGFDDRRSSIAATIDGISDKDDLESLPADMTATTPLISNTETLKASEEKKARPVSMPVIELERISSSLEASSLEKEDGKSRPRSASLAETAATSIFGSGNEEVSKPKERVVEVACPKITEELLPATPSRVVTSYRTNEWAKHLSNAEIPTVETLEFSQVSRPPLQTQADGTERGVEQDSEEHIDNEIPAPLDMHSLQQTATNATPAPAPRLRSEANSKSMMSLRAQLEDQKQVPRSASAMSLGQQKQGPPLTHHRMQQGRQRSSGAIRQSVQRSGSSLSVNAEINNGHRSTSSPSPVPLYAHASSSNEASTPNLLSQRQSAVKQRHSFMSLKPLAPTPELEALPSGGNTQPSTPGVSSNDDSISVYSQTFNATPEYNGNGNPELERELSDNLSLRERKALILKEREREAASRGTPSALGFHNQQNQLQSFKTRSRSRQSSMGQTPGQKDVKMALWRASVQEDLRSKGVSGQRSSSSLANLGGYGNGYGMGGSSTAAPQNNGRLSATQEQEIDTRREQLFEEKRREGFMAAMKKNEEERRRGEKESFMRGGALDGRSGVEGAHREVMRRLQRKASNV